MDGEELFWLNIWRTAGICAVLLAVTVATCSMTNTVTIVKSADPLVSGCAVNGGQQLTASCVALKDKK